MLRELLAELKASGHSVISQAGGLVLTSGTASVTIGHDESGFSTYVQTGTETEPKYDAQDGLTKAEVLALCQQNSAVAAS